MFRLLLEKPPPMRSTACRNCANAFCALRANDGLARLRLMLLVLNPINYTLLALQLYAQIRALAQVWRWPWLAQSIHTRTALQQFDPNTFDPWIELDGAADAGQLLVPAAGLDQPWRRRMWRRMWRPRQA